MHELQARKKNKKEQTPKSNGHISSPNSIIMAKMKIPKPGDIWGPPDSNPNSNPIDLKTINAVSKMIRAFPDVREAFAENPSKFLNDYCGINLTKMGIDPKSMPAKADILRLVDSHLDEFDMNSGPLAIAVCAVVV